MLNEREVETRLQGDLSGKSTAPLEDMDLATIEYAEVPRRVEQQFAGRLKLSGTLAFPPERSNEFSSSVIHLNAGVAEIRNEDVAFIVDGQARRSLGEI